MPLEALPSIEELVAQMEKKKGPVKAAPKDRVTHSEDELHEPQPEESEDVTSALEAMGRSKEGGIAMEEKEAGSDEEPEETPPEETPKEPEPAKKDFLAPKFAALSRREKETRDREAALQKRMDEIEARARDIEERAARIAGVKSPTEALKAYGFSFQDAADDTLKSWKEPEKDPVDVKLQEKLSPLDAKMKEIEEKAAKLDAALEEINKERAENSNRQIRSNLAHTAKEGGYELMTEMGDEAYKLAHDVMIEFYRTHNKVLSFNEACDIVEGHYESLANRFTGTQKIKSRFAATAPTASKSAPQSEAKESPKTLTNRLSQGSHAKPNIDEMSPAEARDYLAKQLRFIS